MAFFRRGWTAAQVVVPLALVFATGIPHAEHGLLNKELLIEDVRQLADILESTHPDPYRHGGGRIAFHRRLHVVLTEAGVVQRGTHSELIGQPGLYAELSNAQTGLLPDRE